MDGGADGDAGEERRDFDCRDGRSNAMTRAVRSNRQKSPDQVTCRERLGISIFRISAENRRGRTWKE